MYVRMAFVVCVEIEITSLFGGSSLKVSKELSKKRKRNKRAVTKWNIKWYDSHCISTNWIHDSVFRMQRTTKVIWVKVSYGHNSAEIRWNAFNMNEDSIDKHMYVCRREGLHVSLRAMSTNFVNYLLFSITHAYLKPLKTFLYRHRKYYSEFYSTHF